MTFNRVRVTIRCVDLDGDGKLDYQRHFELGDAADRRELQCPPPYTEFEVVEAAIAAERVFRRSLHITREFVRSKEEG